MFNPASGVCVSSSQDHEATSKSREVLAVADGLSTGRQFLLPIVLVIGIYLAEFSSDTSPLDVFHNLLNSSFGVGFNFRRGPKLRPERHRGIDNLLTEFGRRASDPSLRTLGPHQLGMLRLFEPEGIEWFFVWYRPEAETGLAVGRGHDCQYPDVQRADIRFHQIITFGHATG